MKRKLYLLIAIVSIVAISATIFGFAVSSRHTIFDTYEVANPKFRIKVTAYHEHPPYSLPGARFVFQSSPPGSQKRHDVLTYHSDEPIAIPRNQVRFVEDQTAYVFIANYYAVTTDGGDSWFVWDANKELPLAELMGKHNLWPAIEKIDIQSDGNGKMTLHPYLTEKERGPAFITSDFGRHWTLAHASPAN